MLEQNDLKAITEIKQQQSETLSEMMDEKIRGVKVLIENDIVKRMDTLFDGYKRTHEKQWELERNIEALQAQVNDLQERMDILEKKVSA